MTGEYEKQSAFPRELVLDDEPGPAAHITRAKADALIAGALAQAGFAELPAEPVAAPVAAPAARLSMRPVRHWAMWQVAAAALLVFAGLGSASAAVMYFRKRMREPEPIVTSLATDKHAKPRRAKPTHEEVARDADKKPIVLDELTIESSKKRAAPKAPEDWLEDANRLRAAQSWKDADETYARVWATAPQSSAAYVARVASAAVRLDHMHDPKTALSRYRAALEQSPRGPLSEEIRYGVAEAYRALGDRARERKALEDFVHEHPGAGLANKARARLSELGSP